MSTQIAIAISATTVIRDSRGDRRPTVIGRGAAAAIVDPAPGLVAADRPGPPGTPDPAPLTDPRARPEPRPPTDPPDSGSPKAASG